MIPDRKPRPYKTVFPYATRTTSRCEHDVSSVIDLISISYTTAAHLLIITPPSNRAIEVSRLSASDSLSYREYPEINTFLTAILLTAQAARRRHAH